MSNTPADRVRYRSVGAGMEGEGPAHAMLILAFCATARSLDEVVGAFGPGAEGGVKAP